MLLIGAGAVAFKNLPIDAGQDHHQGAGHDARRGRGQNYGSR
jgi:hypothetical protein